MDTRKDKGKVIDPLTFTPSTIQGILPKDCPNEWSEIDVAVIVPKVEHEKW